MRDYAALHGAARAHAQGSVAFAVMDVDASAECSEVAAELGLACLPALVVYDGAGSQAGRLASAEDSEGLASLLLQLAAGGAASGSPSGVACSAE